MNDFFAYRRLAAVTAALVLSTSSAFASTAYVATTGDDSTAAVDDSEHPFASIQSAVTALGDAGGTVSVAAGTYAETNAANCVTISTPVEVIGATGNPADVTVTRNGQYARIFNINHASAKLKFITVSGGNTASTTVSSRSGANVYIGANGGVVEDCIIANGTCGSAYNNNGNGAGAYLASSSNARISRCRFTGNVNNRDVGGALYMAGYGTVECCLVTGTTGNSKYPVYLAGYGKLINCTISGNTQATAAGVYAHKNAQVVNCAIFGNVSASDTTGRGHVWDGTAASFINCAADVAIAGTSCVTGWAGLSDNGDFTLTAASCAVDAGCDPTDYGAVSTTDLAGNTWYSGSARDCGCFELDQSSLASDFRFTVSKSVTSVESPAVVSVTAYTLGANGTVSYEWDFGDGSAKVTTNETAITHNYTAAGTYTITLKTTDSSGPVTAIQTDCVKFAPYDLYVDASSTGATYPYDTAAKATTSIQTAIDAAMDGSTVHILDGTYKITSQISITKAITVKGESGAATNVIINAQSKCRGVYIQNADAKLQFVTVTKGKVSGDGGCVNIGTLGGAIEDCILTYGDVSSVYSGKGGGLYMSAGRASRLIISDSKSPGRSDLQGHSGGAAVYGGIIEDSFITRNTAGESCSVYLGGSAKMVNCTIAANTGTSRSGVYVGSDTASVVNCAIFNNTASTDTTGFGGVHCSVKPERYFNCAWDADVTGAVNCQYLTAPLFKDADNGDYRLLGSSPLVDAGTDRADYACVSTTDLDRKTRAVGTVDIGCYENQKDELEASFTVSALQPILPASVTLDGAVVGASGTATYEWTVTNTSLGGVSVTYSSGTSDTYVWTPSAAGTYLVSLKATVGSQPVETAQQSVQIAPKDLYVSPDGTNDFPYDTAAKATTSVQTAIDAAVDGCTVHVLPSESTGLATYSQSVSITKALRLIGETSVPSNVVVYSTGRALTLNNAGAFVANLGFRGASSGSGRAILIEGMGGTISNCFIRCVKNTNGDWGNAASLSANNAFITHCEFTGTATAHLAATYYSAVAILYNSRIENSLIHDVECSYQVFNTTTDGGSVMTLVNSSAVNCSVVNCSCDKASSKSVVVYSPSAITNCVVCNVTNQTGLAQFSNTGSAVNCAWDGAELLSESSIQISSAAFEDFAAGDYRPAQGGALFNADAAVDGYDAITDLAGKPRVYKTLDIGCYEYNPRPGLRISIR